MSPKFKKSNYFYIDESGGILNDSPAFILGCTRTDTPDLVKNSIAGLLKEFEQEIYFAPMLEQITEQGFHAVENHPDVRARFFAILPVLNLRSFFCIINKNISPFKELISKGAETEVYLIALDKILKGRFNNREDENVFIFEELQFKEGTQQKILEAYFAPHIKDGNVRFEIVSKAELNLATTDYMNYIFHTILTAKELKKQQRMLDNLELVKSKIAFINILPPDVFLTRHDTFDAEKIVQLYTG
ncbi:MAG: hypothetical protein V4450_17570 [Bacteroidota bacterium]